MIQFVSFGIIVDDIIFPDGQTRMGVLGGGGPQMAWGAAAYARGEGVGLVAGIGADLAPEVLAPLHAARINLDGVRRGELPTPRAWQVLEYDGRRTQVWRMPPRVLSVQLARNWDVLPPAYRAATVFHWGIHPDEAHSLPFARELLAAGKTVLLEPFRPPHRPLTDDELAELLASCTIFSPNRYEAERITGLTAEEDILARLRDLGAGLIALRDGEAGAALWDLHTGAGVRVPAVPARAVDVVGAGNAFCGAMAMSLAADADLAEAAVQGSAAASYMIEQVGLPPALPDPADYARRCAQVRAGLVVL